MNGCIFRLYAVPLAVAAVLTVWILALLTTSRITLSGEVARETNSRMALVGSGSSQASVK